MCRDCGEGEDALDTVLTHKGKDRVGVEGGVGQDCEEVEEEREKSVRGGPEEGDDC